MINDNLGKRLKQYRKNHNLSQEELSKLLFIRRQTISSYERGKRLPSLDILWDLADIYDVSMDELIGRKWNP